MDRSADAPSEPGAAPHADQGGAFDWVVVGGGPHGVCAARALVSHGASVRIVDPAGRLLDRWRARAAALAMTWMRSPQSHHLDALPVALHHFLHRPENADVMPLAGHFRRPLHEAFLRHCGDVVRAHRLEERLVTGRVTELRREGPHLVVSGDGVILRARRVLVATGTNRLRVPEWARALQEEGAPIEHVFGAGASRFVDLVGSGISAVQRALFMHRSTGRTVRLWMRRPLRVQEFDFDRDWAKHRFLHTWARLGDEARQAFLERHPHEGSVPEGLAARFQRAVRNGWIEVEEGIPEVRWGGPGERLVLRRGGRAVEAEGLTLVTGLEPEALPGWLQDTGRELGLPVFGGLPRLGDDLEWGAGVHVSGPLGRLRLGPMASHLIGARWATSMLPGVRMQPA